MTHAEREAYYRHLDNLVILRDNITTAYEEGKMEGLAEVRAERRAEGRAEGIAETTRKMKKGGLSVEQIQQFTGLSLEEITKL